MISSYNHWLAQQQSQFNQSLNTNPKFPSVNPSFSNIYLCQKDRADVQFNFNDSLDKSEIDTFANNLTNRRNVENIRTQSNYQTDILTSLIWRNTPDKVDFYNKQGDRVNQSSSKACEQNGDRLSYFDYTPSLRYNRSLVL